MTLKGAVGTDGAEAMDEDKEGAGVDGEAGHEFGLGFGSTGQKRRRLVDSDSERLAKAGPGESIEIQQLLTINVELTGVSASAYSDCTTIKGRAVLPMGLRDETLASVYIRMGPYER